MSSVELRGVRKSYGGVDAVRRLDLKIKDGEFLTILGPSGSGKTTCLRIIAGLVTPSAGQIFLGGSEVTNRPCYRRNVGMVFQNYALFPHLTAAKNIAFGLEARRVPGAEVAARVAEALSLVQLESVAGRYPHELSGGQQQRIALARAIAIKPDVLLLDEPLSALDLRLRQELRVGIKDIQRKLKLTTLLVTHDQGEALSMSDRVAIMAHGELLQVDTPATIYRQPLNRVVANFVGRVNLFECKIVSNADPGTYLVRLCSDERQTCEVPARPGDAFAAGDHCLLGIRPEDIVMAEECKLTLKVRVVAKDYFGDGWFVECSNGFGGNVIIQLPSRAGTPAIGEEITIGWSPNFCFLLQGG